MTAPEDKLLPAEELIGLADLALHGIKEDSTESDMLRVLVEIIELCMTQGMLAAKDKPKEIAVDDAIAEGFSRWKTIVEYAKDTLDIQIHPLAYFSIMKEMMTGEPRLQPFIDALDKLFKEVIEKAASEIKPVEVIPVDGIDDNMSADDMAKEFFQIWNKLGTFHQNRDSYKTDEEKHMHDRIVALYSRLRAKMPEIHTI